ncbi:CBS domain-containing protein [uncultured Tessaracoccus sp.]|uniref:CBS domain-containing protein n=1 Tax=uncultured Tessaracoccus sp. TaxID=905023 RepID=UPI002637CD54|nr:CBS domain-containing protein [uncultured Tessaracoccus sp.]
MTTNDEINTSDTPTDKDGQSHQDKLDEFVSSNETSAQFPTSYVIECFGRSRRGAIVNRRINEWLAENQLEMFPDISSADYYGDVEIRRLYLDSEPQTPKPDESSNETASEKSAVGGWVLSSLKSDADELDSLEYGDSVSDAIELMQQRNRTKLPLFFSKNDRSTLIGTVTISDLTFDKVSDQTKLINLATTQVPVVGTNEKLFDWVSTILQHGFIYGKNARNEIVQIYTTWDLATHLNSIAAMFLRANEIEELLRGILADVEEAKLKNAIQAKGSLTEVYIDTEQSMTLTKEEVNPSGADDSEKSFSEKLTFADYIKAVADDTIWSEVFSADRISDEDKPRCIRSLNDARLARNRVMHFNRSEIPEDMIPSFEALAVWLRQIIQSKS